MEKGLLIEMGKRYPKTGPEVIMKWADGSFGIGCLTHLNNLIDDGEMIISLLKPDQVHGPVCSGKWDFNKSREILARFPLGIALEDDFSLNVLSSGGLEGIRMAKTSPLNALMSASKEDREEIAKAIIEEFINEGASEEGCFRNMMIRDSLDESVKELPGIKFVFEYNLSRIMTVFLDGWSGSLSINGEVLVANYISGKQFREIVDSKSRRRF